MTIKVILLKESENQELVSLTSVYHQRAVGYSTVIPRHIGNALTTK